MSLLEESRIIIPMQKMSHTNNLDLINIYAEYIMQNARLNEAQAEIKIGEISITSDMQMTPSLWQKVKRN